MDSIKLSESLEDYLEAIAELIEVEGHAHAKEISRKLNVTMPSVTGALRQLDKLGYIEYNVHYPVVLTSSGAAIAHRVIHRHQVLKKFFSGILGLPLEKASECACHIEHVVDEDTIQRFVLFSEAIENRQDARSLQVYLTECIANLASDETADLQVLSSLQAGEQATVVAFGRNLQNQPVKSLKLNDIVSLQALTLDKSAFLLTANQKPVKLPIEIAENIWVRKLPSGP